MMRNLKGFQSDLDRDSYFDTKLGDDSTVGIIKAYANSVIDLSLNEVTVQAKNHTNVQVEKGYLKLESKIVRQSEALFLKLNPIQFGFEVFQRFLSVDSMVISNFFLRRTYLKCVQRIIKIEVDQIQLQIQSLSLGNTREESRLLMWKAPTDKGRAGTPLSLPFEAIIQGGFDKDGLSAEQEPCPLKAIPFQDVKLSIFKMTQDDPSSEDDFVPPPTKKSHSSGTMNLKKSDSQPRIGCESLKSNRSSRRELMDLVRSKRGLSGHEAQPDEQTSSLQDLRAELVGSLPYQQLDLSVKYEQRFELLNKQVGHYLEEHGIPLDLGDAVIFFGLQRQITM